MLMIITTTIIYKFVVFWKSCVWIIFDAIMYRGSQEEMSCFSQGYMLRSMFYGPETQKPEEASKTIFASMRSLDKFH